MAKIKSSFIIDHLLTILRLFMKLSDNQIANLHFVAIWIWVWLFYLNPHNDISYLYCFA